MHTHTHIHTVEYYCHKKNEIFTATWIDLKIISKSDRERQISCDIAYMWNQKKKKVLFRSQLGSNVDVGLE